MNKLNKGILAGAAGVLALTPLFLNTAHAADNSTVVSYTDPAYTSITTQIVSSGFTTDNNTQGVLEQGDVYQIVAQYTFAQPETNLQAQEYKGAATCDKGQVSSSGSGSLQSWDLGTINAGDVVTCTYTLDTNALGVWSSLGDTSNSSSNNNVQNGVLNFDSSLVNVGSTIFSAVNLNTNLNTSWPDAVSTSSASASPSTSSSTTSNSYDTIPMNNTVLTNPQYDTMATVISSGFTKDVNSNTGLDQGDIYQMVIKYNGTTYDNPPMAASGLGSLGTVTCDQGQAITTSTSQDWDLSTAAGSVTCTYVIDTSNQTVWDAVQKQAQSQDFGKDYLIINNNIYANVPGEQATYAVGATTTKIDLVGTTPTTAPSDSSSPTASSSATDTPSSSPTSSTSSTSTPTSTTSASTSPSASPSVKTTILSGTIFDDKNGNGTQDTGENPTPGAKVELLDTNNNLVQVVSTDSAGKFTMMGVVDGNYILRATNPTTGVTTEWSVSVVDGTPTMKPLTNSSPSAAPSSSATSDSSSSSSSSSTNANNSSPSVSLDSASSASNGSNSNSSSAGYNKGTSVATGEPDLGFSPLTIIMGAGIASAAGLSFMSLKKKK